MCRVSTDQPFHCCLYHRWCPSAPGPAPVCSGPCNYQTAVFLHQAISPGAASQRPNQPCGRTHINGLKGNARGQRSRTFLKCISKLKRTNLVHYIVIIMPSCRSMSYLYLLLNVMYFRPFHHITHTITHVLFQDWKLWIQLVCMLQFKVLLVVLYAWSFN